MNDPEAKRTVSWHAWAPWAALAVILVVVTGIRLRLLELPLERDEGEYAYAGQLMLQGIPPYSLAYNMKWPGTYAAYAAIMAIFGQTIAGIHLGLIVVTLATAVLTFVLARRICGDAGAVVAAGTCALLGISPPTLGIAAHATHFVILPALAAVLLLRDADLRRPLYRVFAAGVLIGTSALAKQAGAAFGLFAVWWLARPVVWRDRANRRRAMVQIFVLAAGGLLPIGITALLLERAGVFDRFWHWTIRYAAAYASIEPFSNAATRLVLALGDLVPAAPMLWGLGAAGLALLWLSRSMREWRGFVVGFVLVSFLAVCPGWYFRGHYFLLFLPALGLLAGVAVRSLSELLERAGIRVPAASVAFVLFGVAAAHALHAQRAFYFELAPARASRALYRSNPFPESVEIGRFLDQHCPPSSTIAVIGSEPQIYFYSRRHSATGYLYTYPLMEPQPYAEQMQAEMIAEIERAKPRYVVFVSIANSWVVLPESHRLIFDWFETYRQGLRLAGYVEILSKDETRYRLPHDGSPITPQSRRWIAIYENPAAE